MDNPLYDAERGGWRWRGQGSGLEVEVKKGGI